MTQVDLEAIGGGAGTDRKIACEKLVENTKDEKLPPENSEVEGLTVADVPPDFPPESFWLSKDAELDWLDRNAFYERNESTKGSSQTQTSSNSNSQRFSLNLTSTTKSIFGLAKTPKATKPANTRSNPKRTEWVDKRAGSVTEPSSPKVSCMGRVRSKRRSRSSSEPEKMGKPVERSRSSRNENKDKKTGICSGFMSMFKSGKTRKRPVQKESGKTKEELKVEEEAAPRLSKSASRRSRDVSINIEPVAELPRMSKSASKRGREITVNVEPVAEAPGLGGIKRFASGRRSIDELIITGSFV